MAACSARVVLALVLVLGGERGGFAQDAPPPPQILHAVAVEGATVFTEADLVRRLNLTLDGPLPKAPQELVRDIEAIYKREGYAAARATATIDQTGALTIGVRFGEDELNLR